MRGGPADVSHLFWASDGKHLISGNTNWTALVWNLAPQDEPESGQTQERLTRAWDQLKTQNARTAYHWVWDLTEMGDASAILLAKYLRPAARPVHAEQIAKLIAELDDSSFAKREAASRQLAQLGGKAEPALTNVVANTTSPEVRSRAESLLKELPAAALDPWSRRYPVRKSAGRARADRRSEVPSAFGAIGRGRFECQKNSAGQASAGTPHAADGQFRASRFQTRIVLS